MSFLTSRHSKREVRFFQSFVFLSLQCIYRQRRICFDLFHLTLSEMLHKYTARSYQKRSAPSTFFILFY